MIVSLWVFPKQERMNVSTPRMESNKDDLIVIDSDEEGYILSAIRKPLPSDDECDLSEGPSEEPTEKSSKLKVSSQKALRIQLRGISKDKLSINRANLLKSQELEIENMRLLQLLAVRRKQVAVEKKLCEEADVRLRSCGLRLNLGGRTDSPIASAGQSFQAITSIALTSQIPQSKTDLVPNSTRNVAKDFIARMQESTLLQSRGAPVTAIDVNLKGFQGCAIMHIKVNGYISDQESSLPKLCYFKQHWPERQICISKLLIEDIDEVTSSLKE